ncbi:MAG: hypothetical protein ACM3ZC_02355 [Bacteroidota bacterium]
MLRIVQRASAGMQKKRPGSIMMKITGKQVFITAYVYLAIPIAIFMIGWLKPLYGIPITSIISVAMFKCFKSFEILPDNNPIPKNIFFWLVITLIILLWVGLSGIGGFVFQNDDHRHRNAVLHDLIDYSWPVIYDYSGLSSDFQPLSRYGALVYYLTYWLPAAMIGKLLGWQVANLILYFWSAIGVWLAYCLFSRYLKKYTLVTLIVLIFWSGMDILGIFINQINFSGFTQHLEWWTGIFQYSSNCTTLFWVFNQTIPIWVLIGILINLPNKKNIIFTYALAFPYAPFPFLGLTPFIIYHYFVHHHEIYVISNDKRKSIWHRVWQRMRQGLTFQNTIAAILIFAIFSLYYCANFNAIYRKFVFIDTDIIWVSSIYFMFCILEFGFYAFLLFKIYRNNSWFIIAIFSLILIPFYYMGPGNDFAMRASIPALLILMLCVLNFILNNKNYILRKLF